MKTADRENPNSRAWLRNKPSNWGGRRETSSLMRTGWKTRKSSGGGSRVFLDFPFYRTSPAVAIFKTSKALAASFITII